MEPPSFSTSGPQVVRAAPGSDASLLIPLPSGTPPFHYEWSRAGAKLDSRFKPADDVGGVRLTISSASTGDSGVYTLQASNAAGKDTTRVRLEVSPDEKPTGDDPPTFLRRLQDLTVKVGTRTRFLVEIVSSTECRVTWYRNERRLLEAERIALVRDGNFWCADVSAVSVDDAGRWTCTAENLGGRASCSAHLNVLVPKAYKRPEFVEELRALLTEQGTVSLECKVVGVPTPVLRWFKDSREIKAGDVFALTANAEDPTSLGTYTCEAVNCMGRAYSSSKVHVIGRSSREGSARPTSGGLALEPPPIFTKELEDQFVRICEPLTLSCNIVVPPWPRSIVWYNKEGKIEPSERYRVLEDGVGGYLLEVPSAEWPDEGEWKCVATSSGGRVGITTCYVSMDVPKNYRKPRFMENLQAVLTEEGLVSFECKVVGFPTPVLSWFKDGQELKPGDVYQLTGTNSLGSYCCIARNCMGQASSSAELTVEDIQNQLNEEEKLQLFSKNQAPKFLQGLKSIEAKIDEPFRFTIKVAIPPEPTVLWYRDDQPVDESSRCHHGKEERGVFFLDIQSLEFMDQAEWKCVAMNDYGHSVTSCFLKLIIPRHYKKPRFLENLQAILSDQGAVNLECKVIGVPQPVLKWYKDGEELKPGDIHRIISGQDGTCCLGTYTCEAQNCMGIAASSASLLGFEDSIKSKTKQKVDEQTLQRNLSLSTIHEERTSQMYDTPVGDITLDDKGEISFSFDGKEVSVSLYETPDLTEEEALQIVEMYADQLSENVTEHNVVELPPLRFVKETSTSGNLLMEAIIIDVSPEYFTSPEEDLRTEADVEDISIADENGPPQLSLDQDVNGEDYLEKTMALLADEKADFPKKTDRKKSDSQKSADDYFSLSRDQSLSEEKKDDDSQALSGSDLQSFASARSSGKPKSKSSKPSIEDGQESSDVTKTVLLKEELQTLRQNNEIDSFMKSKCERRSRSSRRSSSGSEKSLNKMKEEVLEGNLENTVIKTLEQESTKSEINTISSSLTKLINDVQMIERDIILKSELMSTAATASRSLEIINSLITPLSEIHSIAEAITELVTESFQGTKSLFNRLPQSLSTLHQSLTIIEKCIDLESENKTLVKKTCTNIIEKCGDELNKLVKDISSIVDKDCPFLEDVSISSIQKTNNDILNTISSSVATIKECKKFSDKIDTKADMVTPEINHLQKTQKAVYELRNPLKSLIYIVEEVDISSFTSAENVTNSQVILNEMSTPIQALQNALEQIELLSVAETQTELQKYNTEIMETVMESVIKLRTSFEQLSVEAGTMENIEVFEKVLVDIKHIINEISAQLDIFEAKIGSFDVLHSENKLEALQKMAQILINLENSLVILDINPCLKINMADFHKNLTKILEHVIESNDPKKYLTFLEICDAVDRLNTLIKNMDSNDIFLLTGISNTLKIIQAIIKKNEFTQQLKLSIIKNITDLLLNIQETMNHADTSTYSMISENVEELSTRHFEEGKLNIVLEQIEKAISTISNVVSLESTKDLDIQQAFSKIIPTLGEIKCCVASLNVNVTEQDENISDMSNFTFIQAVAKPLHELNLGISVLNQTICEKSADYCENELEVELATPLLELRNALEILQQDVISQYSEDFNNLNISSSVANAVQSIHSCIVMVQEQDLLENADELSTLEDISAIKTSVDILSSDYFVSPTVHEITTAIGTQVIAEIETPIMQFASARTLRHLNEHILILQKPEFMEILKALSEYAEYSCMKSITEGLDKIHKAIEVILYPVALEESQKLLNFIYSTQLSSIMQPLQELQEHLSVIDINNMPVESALQMDQKKFRQCLSKFKNCLRDSIDCIHVSIETTDVVLDISTQIETLRKLCIELKNDIEKATYDNLNESSELIMLHDSVTTALDAISCPQEINITRVKLSLHRLQQSITLVKDELFGLAFENPTVLHNETRNLKSIEGIEKTIASLAQLQFVDLNQDSVFDYYVSEQGDKETKYEPIIKIKEIVETVKNCTQHLPLFMPNNNDLSAKDFVDIFNDEITLLCCLLNQKPTPKRLIKMLQLFYDLCKNLKQFQLNEKSYTSKDFSEQMDTLEKCLKNVQVILLEVLNSQSHLVFETPITNIINNEILLNKLLESNETLNLHNFVKLLMTTIKSIKPWFENILADVVKELESWNVNLTIEEDAAKKFSLLQSYLSEKTENNDINDERDIFEAILRVIQKHEDCKHTRGSAQKIIFIKCISDCLNILKRTLLDNNGRVLNDESTLDLQNLKEFLTQLSEPIDIFHKKIVKICNENLQNITQSFILKELELLESQVKAISNTKIAEKLLKCENLPIGTFTDNSIINLAKEIVIQIHSIQNSLQNLESAYSFDMSINSQHIKEIERILTTLIPNEDIDGENMQLKQKADSLMQHMEQYIEIIEIVEEVSAVIRLDDLKKSADIVRELRESITSEKLPDINVASPEFSIKGKQIQLVQNLQKALKTLQIEAFECEQELGPHINDDIRQQIIEKVSELQNDLVGLTGIYAVLETSEPFESIKQTGKNCIISIQEEDVVGPENVIENKEYAIGDSQENHQESLNVSKSDLVAQCDFPQILQTEVSQPKTEISMTPTPDSYDEKQSLTLMSQIKLSDSKILDLSMMKIDPIKESLIMHINDFLCQDIIENIKKILPSKNIEQLEQSLQIAVEVRDNAVLEDSYPFAQQVCLEKQLELVLKLQEVTLAIYHKNLNDADDETLQSHIGQDSLKTAKSVVHNLLDSIQMYIMSLNTIILGETVVVPVETCTENLQNATKSEINMCDKNNSVSNEQSVDVLKEEQRILQENNNYEIFGDGNNFTDINMLLEDTKVVENQQVSEESKKEKTPIIEVVMEEEKVDEKYLETTLSESEKSLDSETLNDLAVIEKISETNITDSMKVQEEIKENNKNQIECNINDSEPLTEVNNMSMDNNLLSVTDTIKAVKDDSINSARKDTNTNEEISNTILELETLLHEVNETLNLFDNCPEVHKSEELQDTLEEVQTIIMKLKYGFDGSVNDILNENIEDLECNVRSVQLQINENSPPALLKEACANLQTLAAYMKTIHITQNTKTRNNVLCICTNDAEQAIELLDKVSSYKVESQFDNIILNLGVIKDTMKSLKSCFLDNADSLILRGVEVLQNLDNVEDKVFALEKEADAIENMDINFRDSIIAAIHSIYGSISNMRGTICSIQKKYMHDNYGQPSDNFLKSIKNISFVLNYDKKDGNDWKQFTKALRKILKHFEDVKFYINFDKTARLPSDSAFTKIILHELTTVLSGVVFENTKELDENLTSRVEDTLNYISEILKNMENKSTVEVKEKIPIFKELSIKIFDLTNSIKIVIKKNMENIDQLSIDKNVISKNEENISKITPDDGNNDENHLLKMIQAESTNGVTSVVKNISEFVGDSFEMFQDKSAVHERLEEFKKEAREASDIQMIMVELEEVNPYENKDRETDKNQEENEMSSCELLNESTVAMKGVVQEKNNLKEEIVNQDIEIKVRENNKPTIDDDLGSIEAKIEDQTQKQMKELENSAMDVNKMYDIGLENIDDETKTENLNTVLESEKVVERTDEEIISVQTNDYQGVNLSMDQHKNDIKNHSDIITRQTSDTKQEDAMENQKKVEREIESLNKQQASNNGIEAGISITTNDKGAVNIQIDKHDIINQQNDQEVSNIIEKAQESEIGHDKMEIEKQKTIFETEKGIEKRYEEIISVQTNDYQGVNSSLDQHKTETENQFDIINSDTKHENVMENEKKKVEESDTSNKQKTSNNEIEGAVSITKKDKGAVDIQIDKHDITNQKNDQEMSKIIEKAQETEICRDKREIEKQKTILETEQGVEKTDEEIISVQTNDYQDVNSSLDQHKTETENQFDIINSDTKHENVMENEKKKEEKSDTSNKQKTSNNEIEAAVSITTKDKGAVDIQIDKHDITNQKIDQEMSKIIEKAQETEICHDKMETEKQKTELKKEKDVEKTDEKIISVQTIGLENIDDETKTENLNTVLESEKVVERTDEEIISVQTNDYQGVNLSLDQHKTETENQFDIITQQTSDIKQEDVMENQKKKEEESDSLNKQQILNNEIEAAVSITTKDKGAVNVQIQKHDIINHQNDQEVSKVIEKAQESEICHDKIETVLKTEKGVEKTDEEIISVQTKQYQGVNLSLDQQKTAIENQFDITTQQTSDTKQEDVMENQNKKEGENDSLNKQQTSNNEIEAAVSITTKDKDAVNIQIDKHDTINQQNDQEVSKIIEKAQESEICHDKMETVLKTEKGVEKIDEEIISVQTKQYQGVNLSLDQQKTEIENQFDIVAQQTSDTKHENVMENQKKKEEKSDTSNKQKTSNNEIEAAVSITTKDKGTVNIQIDKHDIINQQNDQEGSKIIEKAQQSEIGHLEDVVTSFKSNSMVAESVNIQEAKEDKFYSTMVQSHIIEDFQNEHDDLEKHHKYDKIIPLPTNTQIKYTELKDSNVKEENESIILLNENSVVNTKAVQKDEKEDKDSTKELVKLENKDDTAQKNQKLLISEQMVDIENVKVDDMTETQKVEISEPTDPRNKAKMEDDLKKEMDVMPPKSTDLEIIYQGEEESLRYVEINKFGINDKKLSKDEEIKKENVLEIDRDVNSVKENTLREDISIVKYDKTTTSRSLEICDVVDKTEHSDIMTEQTEKPISVQTTEMVEVNQGNINSEAKNKIISEKPAEVRNDSIENLSNENNQQCINDFQQDFKDDANTEKAETMKDVCELQDVFDKNMKEEIKKVSTDVDKKEQCKYNKEEDQEEQLNQNSKLIKKNEKGLQDETKETEYKLESMKLEEVLSKHHMKELDVEKPFDEEPCKNVILTMASTETTESTLTGKHNDTTNLEKENENKHDLKNIDNIEAKLKSEFEKNEIQDILKNGAMNKETDSKASYQNADVEIEKKEFLAPEQHIQKEQDQQQVTLGTAENESNLDSKFEKIDGKSKTKIKKTTKAKEKQYLNKQEEAKIISQEDQHKIIMDEELVKKKEESEINKYSEEIKIEEKNGNNVKTTPVTVLGEQLLVQGDESDEQKIPGKMLQQKQATDQNEEKEVATIILQDDQQQTKLEIDEALKIVHKDIKEISRSLDGRNIEKKGIDSTENNQSAMKTESLVMSEKQLKEMPIIETNVINIQSEVQKEDKQNWSTELSNNEINDQIKHDTIKTSSMGENKVTEKRNNGEKSKKSLKKEGDTAMIPSDSQIQKKIIDTEKNDWEIKKTHNNGCEILKSNESFSDKETSLLHKEAKGLQKTENVITEFRLDMKQSLSKDELQETNQEKIITNRADIQESSILSGNEIKMDSKASKYKDIKQRPLFTDRNKPDYEQEFARPPGYFPKTLDIDNSPMEFKATSKSPTIYRAQTLVQESQLKNSLPPQIDQRSNFSEGRSDLKQRLSTTSESRSTILEKRGSFPRDFKRKPVFSTHLTDRTAVESSRVKLTCSVLSSTDPVISWYKNGVLLDNKHKCRTKYVDGLITLEILNAIPSDSGEYSCSVENENGSITSSAHLKVYPGFEASPIPPTFTRSIRDIYHLHENELVLECRIRGQPLPIITWLKDNIPITLNERYQAHYLADGVCRLTITSPNQDDSGKYTCKAENSMWSDQISHEVYFSTKESRYIKNIATPESIRINRQATESRRPHFTNVLSDHKVVSGGTIGLQVEISGSPTRVEWLREGQSVTETYRNAQTYIDHGLYTLALSDVTEKESGQYTCRAWSSHGTVDMNASITVVQPNQFEGKPARIISRPVKDLLISVGEDLNISFRVQGEPKPKVFLMKGIRDISNSQRVCKMTSDDYVKFTLKRSVISDAGTYCVFVRNAYGCDRAFVTVVIRQRASSEHLISDWTYPMDDLAISVVDRNYQSVPDRIPSEPTTVDGGTNWVSLAWPKPESQVKAPILAYKVESWLLGKEGGARWLELGITPRNCFDIFNLKQGEEYHFRVTPRNRYGWGESVQTSSPIGIGLAGDRPEFIEILPGQLKVLVGETATLCCSFKGNPIPEIVWMKNGHELEEEAERVRVQLNGNNTSLCINEIKIEDEGRYSCEATNIHGCSSTYSRMAVITDRQIWEADAKLKRERSAGANGEYPPQFTMRLRDRRVQATYPVRLTCQVIGSPSPTVKWFKNGEEVSVDSRHTTSQDEYFYTLEIAPTTLDDGGVYEAMARNGYGAISCRCNLVVDKGIRAYIAPEFCCGFEPLYRVCEGDELRISAVVEAYPSVGVTWYRDGVRLRTSRRAVMTLDRDGQIELALASVAPRDAGVYTCTASNEVGKASTSGKVEVVKGEHTSDTLKVPPIVISPDLPYSKEPMFIRKPRSSEAHEGDTVIIECEVIGDPKPDVYWLRDFLKPDYYRDASHFKRVGAGPAYRFEIPHAKFDYTGAYSIVAKNIHGEAKAIISLQILAKDILIHIRYTYLSTDPTCGDDTHNIRYGRVEVIPRFDKELTDLLCYDGDAIEFECRVSGNPEPDIRWFHYTETLPECPDFETSYDLGTARLKIKQVTAEDEGTYTCEASNNLGKATSSACLVIYPPGEPNTLSQRLRRPPALISASSTPRSTPRTTPARSLSRTPGPDLRRLCSPSREIAPKFYTYPYNRVVEEGDTVVFQCAVRGLPPPWATWDKDGIVITPTARISIREKDDMFRLLEIEQVTIEDVGLYRVTLENDYGRAEASARLEVISQTGKFYGSRSYSVSPRKCLPYRRRTPSLTRQD